MIFVIRKKGTDLYAAGDSYGDLQDADRYDSDEMLTKDDLDEDEEAVETRLVAYDVVVLPDAPKPNQVT